MTKRESKGQQVKTFKHFVMLPSLESEVIIGKVYFQADSGRFAIYLPEHVAAVAASIPHNEYDGRSGLIFNRDQGGYLTHKVIDTVIDGYKGYLTRYEDLLRTQKRRKVIAVTFRQNIRWIKGFHDVRNSTDFAGYGARRGDISFCGAPAIHLTYAVRYEVGGKLYQVVNHDDGSEHMTYAAQEGKIIDWTPDRENFFANTVGNIERLIMAMIEFMDDIEGNIDRAIANNDSQLQIAAR